MFFSVISKLNTGSVLHVRTQFILWLTESLFLAVDLCTAHCCDDPTLLCVDACAVDGINDAARCLS